jgi:hypothetical protein
MRGDEEEHGYYRPVPPEPPKKNGLLTLLLSSGGDTTVKLVTLALVVVSGGGNFFATREVATETEREISRVVMKNREFQTENIADLRRGFQEVHDLRMDLDPAIARQKKILDILERIEKKLNEPPNK